MKLTASSTVRPMSNVRPGSIWSRTVKLMIAGVEQDQEGNKMDGELTKNPDRLAGDNEAQESRSSLEYIIEGHVGLGYRD
jgi:hypothetical protein